MSARRPLDPAALLGRAVAAHARSHGHAVTVADVTTRPWASATFEGERVGLALHGSAICPLWVADLPEADLRVRGYLVADLAARTAAPSVHIEALLIRDA